MSKKNLIHVERRHIEGAMPESSSKCMIAEAIKDWRPGVSRLHVDLATIRFTDEDGNRHTFLTPGKCQVGLVEFDAGIPVQPFTFYLANPIHIRDQTAKSGRGRRALVKIHKQNRSGRHDDIEITKIGGAQPPVLRNVTRRRFGIRGLRVNEQLQVVGRDE